MAKIDQNLEFFSFCSHPIHSGNNLFLFLQWSYQRAVVEIDRRVWGPLGGPPGGPKGSKMVDIDPWGSHPEAILGPSGTPWWALILVYYFLQLPLHKSYIRIVKICCQIKKELASYLLCKKSCYRIKELTFLDHPLSLLRNTPIPIRKLFSS